MKYTKRITSLYNKLEELTEEMNEYLEDLDTERTKIKKRLTKIDEEEEETQYTIDDVENSYQYLSDHIY